MPISSEKAMAASASSSEFGRRDEVELEHRRAVVERLAEVAAEQARHEEPVLHPERLIQAELLADGVDVGLAGSGLHQQRGRVAGDADEQEDGQRQQQQREQRVAEPPSDVTALMTPSRCRSMCSVSVMSS